MSFLNNSPFALPSPWSHVHTNISTVSKRHPFHSYQWMSEVAVLCFFVKSGPSSKKVQLSLQLSATSCSDALCMPIRYVWEQFQFPCTGLDILQIGYWHRQQTCTQLCLFYIIGTDACLLPCMLRKFQNWITRTLTLTCIWNSVILLFTSQSSKMVDETTVSMITVQNCKILSYSIMSHCAVFWYMISLQINV